MAYFETKWLDVAMLLQEVQHGYEATLGPYAQLS